MPHFVTRKNPKQASSIAGSFLLIWLFNVPIFNTIEGYQQRVDIEVKQNGSLEISFPQWLFSDVMQLIENTYYV